jgi:Asp-tRNA(Asn)/Glu-tRNA(Gln) amidotransferase A subunit family amidase
MAEALWRLGAGALARGIAGGDISASEAVEAHIARIEAVNAALNAVIVKRYTEARAEAEAADRKRARGETLGPLHGVPISLKECIDLAGTPSSFGLAKRAALYAESDEVHVARLRQAGAIILAKTNVAQLLLYVESDNPVHGRTANPWDLARSPGGSSGGEAALIAAGGTPLGLGTDIGGSIRCPASFCGIAGLKPTEGRCPDPGRFSVPVGERAVTSQIGPLAREVGDLALALSIIDGAGEPSPPLGDYRTVDLSRLSVACFEDDGDFPPSPAHARAVREAAEMLRQAGVSVVQWRPPEIARAIALFYGLLSGDGGAGGRAMLRGEKRDPRLTPLLIGAGLPGWAKRAAAALLEVLGQRRSAATLRVLGSNHTHAYWESVAAQLDYRRGFAAALDASEGGRCHAILCPAFAVPALPHGLSRDLGLPGAYTLLANLLGWPAGVVPVTRIGPGEESARPASRDLVERAALKAERGSAGLPVGVQVIARPWQEHVVLALMQAIESAARRRADYPRTPV